MHLLLQHGRDHGRPGSIAGSLHYTILGLLVRCRAAAVLPRLDRVMGTQAAQHLQEQQGAQAMQPKKTMQPSAATVAAAARTAFGISNPCRNRSRAWAWRV